MPRKPIRASNVSFGAEFELWQRSGDVVPAESGSAPCRRDSAQPFNTIDRSVLVMTHTPTLAFAVLDALDLIVSVQGRAGPTDSEWDAYFESASQRALDARPYQFLVLTRGGRPTPAQVRRLREAMAPHPRARVAVVTDSAGVLFVVSALALANPLMRCFKTSELDQAFVYLGVKSTEVAIVEATRAKLEQKLGKNADPAA